MTTDLQMQHRYCIVGGLRLHWAEMGETTDTAPIVLLHGINDSHLSWKLIAPLLAVHRRVLMPDLPGCGLSGRPDASYSLAWHARVVADWLSHIALASADFVGHSFGGGVAQMLLLECPSRVRRLALIAPGGFGRDVGGWLRLVGIMPGLVEALGQPFMALGTRLALRGSPFSEEEVTTMSAMNTTRGTARAFARTSRDVVGWRGQRHSFLQRAHEIAVLPPIAVYWGDRDALIPIGQGVAFVRAVQGVSLRAFPGCGHFLHHEQPTAFAASLCEFLDLPSAPRAYVRAALPKLAPTRFVEAGAPAFYGILTRNRALRHARLPTKRSRRRPRGRPSGRLRGLRLASYGSRTCCRRCSPRGTAKEVSIASYAQERASWLRASIAIGVPSVRPSNRSDRISTRSAGTRPHKRRPGLPAPGRASSGDPGPQRVGSPADSWDEEPIGARCSCRRVDRLS